MSTEELPASVRLFPLPNYVFFPSVTKGFHIFEPRYCAMLEDALATDKIVAMALLQPGWESDYLGTPPIFPVITLGKVVWHEPTADGRHNILLHGLSRATVASEILSKRGYRIATVASWPRASDELIAQLDHGRERLLKYVDKKFAWTMGGLNPYLKKHAGHSSDEIRIDQLIDFVGHQIEVPAAQKQRLLEEPCIEKRLAQLGQILDAIEMFDLLSGSQMQADAIVPKSTAPWLN